MAFMVARMLRKFGRLRRVDADSASEGDLMTDEQTTRRSTTSI